MSIATRIQQINQIVHYAMPVACHTATFIATYWSLRGVAPKQEMVMNVNLRFGFTNVLTRMLPHGKQITDPLIGNPKLTPGSVVIFVDSNNTAGHSCVAIDKYTLGGFNQDGWYSGNGGNHTYSAHNTREIIWMPWGKRVKKRGQAVGDRTLIQVPEDKAKDVIHQLMQEFLQ
jgi:hypothetical protein